MADYYFSPVDSENWIDPNNWFQDSGFSDPWSQQPGPDDAAHLGGNTVMIDLDNWNGVTSIDGGVAEFFSSDGDNPSISCGIDSNPPIFNAGNFIGSCAGDANFYGTSNNNGTVSGDATFNDSSTNQAAVNGSATFNGGTSMIGGTISGDATFGGSMNGGTVVGDAVFAGGSYLSGTVEGVISFTGSGFNGTNIDVDYVVVFSNGSSNQGTITNAATFNDESSNEAAITSGPTIFNGSATNAGSIEGGDVTFNGAASNNAAISSAGTIAFNDSSQNGVSGSVPACTFSGSATNSGAVYGYITVAGVSNMGGWSMAGNSPNTSTGTCHDVILTGIPSGIEPSDLSVTPANVSPSANAVWQWGVAGGTVTAGQTVYLDGAGRYQAANIAGGAPEYLIAGIAINSAHAGQPVAVMTQDPAFTPGCTLAKGQAVFASATSAGLTAAIPLAASGSSLAVLGAAISETQMSFKVNPSNVVT